MRDPGSVSDVNMCLDMSDTYYWICPDQEMCNENLLELIVGYDPQNFQKWLLVDGLKSDTH